MKMSFPIVQFPYKSIILYIGMVIIGCIMILSLAPMIFLAYISIISMVLFPTIGIILLVKKKTLFNLKAIGIICLSIPSFLLCNTFWPIDFLYDSELRFGITEGDYQIDVVQRPGFDFYDTDFEIRRSDNKSAIWWIDPDDKKWWGPHIKKIGNKVYFLKKNEKIDKNSAYVDLKNMILYGYYFGTKHIDSLDFK